MSPGYPGNYPNTIACTWILVAPPGYSVMVEITHFNLESCCDYLKVVYIVILQYVSPPPQKKIIIIK